MWKLAQAYLLVLCIFAVRVMAQVDQGQIAGTVMDSSKAIVPGVKVTVENPKTGATQSATTGQNGSYIITNLPVSDYTVSAQAAGFKTFVRTNVRVSAATRATVDITLEVGMANQTVEVVYTAPQMQQETAQIGRTVESRQVTDLALNGRNPMNLALLKAGVVGGNFNAFNPDSLGGGLVSINGGDTRDNAITMDGVNILRTRGGEMVVGVLNADAIQEVQILTSTYPAEYGRSKDGHIRFVSKMGTREFHGTAYEFFRNSALDANSWVRNRSTKVEESSRPAPFRFNQPGYTLGGPVFIPGIFNTSKDKLFFFVGQEWIRFRQESTATATVPSALMRQGDFSELLDPKNPWFNAVKIVRNPSTGQPFANNQIPVGQRSRNGMALMNAWPKPTPGFQLGAANWIQSRPLVKNSRKDSIRLDYNAGIHRINFSGSYFSYYQSEAFYSGMDIAPSEYDRPNFSAVIGVTSNLSPTLVNDFSFAAAADSSRFELHPTDGQKLWERDRYGVDFPYLFPTAEKVVPNRLPETTAVTGFTTLPANNRPASSSGPMFTLADNLTWVRSSSHTLKFGVNLAYEQNNNNDQTNWQNGAFTFLDTGNPLSTGLAIANLALGNYNTYQEAGKGQYTLARSRAVEAYAQDTWRVSKELTLELGVRYSNYQPWFAKWNDFVNFDQRYWDPTQVAQVDRKGGFITGGDRYNGLVLPGDGYPPEAAGRAYGASNPDSKRLFHGLPRGLVNSYNNAFAPRLGIAYLLAEKTVIRAGGGVFHNRQFLDTYMFIKMPPNTLSADLVNGVVDNPGGAGVERVYPFTVNSMDWEAKYPTSYSYSFSVQQQIPGSMLLDVSYVGKISTHLPRWMNINQLQQGTLTANPGVNANALRPYLGLGPMRHRQHTGRATYNSLQVSLDRRFTSGLGFGVAYTFSKDIRDVSTPHDAYRAYLIKAPQGVAHILNLNYIYELPFFHGQRGLVGSLLGGWQVSGVTFFRSGSRLSVTDSTDVAGVGPGSGSAPWNLVGNTAAPGERGLDKAWFNPKAFALPAAGTFGNAGLGIITGPSFQNWDIALFKTFRIGEKLSSQIRFEAFNFVNHPVLADPSTNPRSGSFGVITSKSEQRNIQLGLKFIF